MSMLELSLVSLHVAFGSLSLAWWGFGCSSFIGFEDPLRNFPNSSVGICFPRMALLRVSLFFVWREIHHFTSQEEKPNKSQNKKINPTSISTLFFRMESMG